MITRKEIYTAEYWDVATGITYKVECHCADGDYFNSASEEVLVKLPDTTFTVKSLDFGTHKERFGLPDPMLAQISVNFSGVAKHLKTLYPSENYDTDFFRMIFRTTNGSMITYSEGNVPRSAIWWIYVLDGEWKVIWCGAHTLCLEGEIGSSNIVDVEVEHITTFALKCVYMPNVFKELLSLDPTTSLHAANIKKRPLIINHYNEYRDAGDSSLVPLQIQSSVVGLARQNYWAPDKLYNIRDGGYTFVNLAFFMEKFCSFFVDTAGKIMRKRNIYKGILPATSATSFINPQDADVWLIKYHYQKHDGSGKPGALIQLSNLWIVMSCEPPKLYCQQATDTDTFIYSLANPNAEIYKIGGLFSAYDFLNAFYKQHLLYAFVVNGGAINYCNFDGSQNTHTDTEFIHIAEEALRNKIEANTLPTKRLNASYIEFNDGDITHREFDMSGTKNSEACCIVNVFHTQIPFSTEWWAGEVKELTYASALLSTYGNGWNDARPRNQSGTSITEPPQNRDVQGHTAIDFAGNPDRLPIFFDFRPSSKIYNLNMCYFGAYETTLWDFPRLQAFSAYPYSKDLEDNPIIFDFANIHRKGKDLEQIKLDIAMYIKQIQERGGLHNRVAEVFKSVYGNNADTFLLTLEIPIPLLLRKLDTQHVNEALQIIHQKRWLISTFYAGGFPLELSGLNGWLPLSALYKADSGVMEVKLINR